MKVTLYSSTSSAKTIMVSDQLFVEKANEELVSQAVRIYLSNLRQGTHKVKTRSEINRTKAKWFKQKGTGNARHGAKTANIFVGGGVAHGPEGKTDWRLKFPPTLKRKALMNALTMQVEHLVITDDLEMLDGKTKSGAELIRAIAPANQKVLVVLEKTQPLILRSLRNLENVLVTQAKRLTTLEVAMADTIIMAKSALDVLDERLVRKTTKKVEVVEKPKKAEVVAPKAKTVTKPKKTTTRKTVKAEKK